ncbi:MAG: type I methionyl aminopeptidase [Chloroflexota bacterium]|nr:type I methionyl aminopeptidase [Chloroflexota bacterium]
MTIRSNKQLDRLLLIGRIVAETLKLMQDSVQPGMTTAELNRIGAKHLAQCGARPAPIIAYKFPGETCISINDECAHGIPGKRVIRPGDLVNIDVSAELGGVYADCGGTVGVGTVSKANQRLMQYTRQALDAAMHVARADAPINVIGYAVEGVAKRGGYSIITALGGHGVGHKLHEEPRNIPNHFDRKERRPLKEGTVLTIEPFFAMGDGEIYEADDGWTLKMEDGLNACQYEHTIVITRGKPIVVTAL